MFRHLLYHSFVLLTYLPLAFLFNFRLVGKRTDDVIYAFRRWCYRDNRYQLSEVGDMTPLYRGVFITGSLIVIMLVVAAMVSMSATVGKSLTSTARNPVTASAPVVSASSGASTSPVKAVKPSVPNMLPVPTMAPVSYTTKLARTVAAVTNTPASKKPLGTAPGHVALVPVPVRTSAAVPTAYSPTATRPRHTYSPTPTGTSQPPSSPVPSPVASTPTPEPSTPTPTATPTVSAVPSDATTSPVPSGSGYSGYRYHHRWHIGPSVSATSSSEPSAIASGSQPAG